MESNSALEQVAFQDNLQALLRDEFGKRNIENFEMPEFFSTSLNPAMQLRPYQKKCFQYFLTYWENSFDGKEAQPHLLFHMATGSGKTLIMAGLMLYLYDKGYRNFLFFVDSTNIIEKTKENFLNVASAKYLFSQQINIRQSQVAVKMVDNFQDSDENSINLCLTTTQGLHTALNNPKENALTYDDFTKYEVVMISDEAHHMNASTKKGKTQQGVQYFNGMDGTETEDWESTVMKIFHTPNQSSLPNVLLEFTATEDFENPLIAEKYRNKIIFSYPLKQFRLDKYSKDIEVVQSDMQPIDRAMQAVILSQYKRKLFMSIGQDIKPVVMMKSKRIADNRDFYENFVHKVTHMGVDYLQKLRKVARDDIAGAFSFFEEKGISLDNLLLELKEDFKEDNLLLVDQKDISPEKQVILNTLETKGNEYRVVFAVDMLNEGWDVLNLFDIVRLYETRDAKNGKPGKTTMQEAQLIGRGARYMPFAVQGTDLPAGKRKFDGDITNRLRVIEKLHYHSSHNSRYVQELHAALAETGIMPDKVREIKLVLKEDFKETDLYKKGVVFSNSRIYSSVDKDVASFGATILSQTYSVRLMSGVTHSTIVMDDNKTSEQYYGYVLMKMRDLSVHVIRAALNRFETYKFSNLHKIFPKLSSMAEFINSSYFLSDLNITIYGRKTVKELSQRDRLDVAVNVLRQIEPLLKREEKTYKGTYEFKAYSFKNIFKDHVIKVSMDASNDKEYGKSMHETENTELKADLSECPWHAYNDCYGTSEEKHLVKYIEAIYPKLSEKYNDIYLVRNEKDLKLWSFAKGEGFEPDYVLFMRKKKAGHCYDAIQIFIEPKGEHLRATDKWKEDFMKEIKGNATIHFATNKNKFEVWGMPFYTFGRQTLFDKAFMEMICKD